MAAIHEEPTGARLPFPFLTYYVLPHLVVTLVVALRPRLFWRLSTLIAVISAQLYAVRFTTGDSYQNYSTGTAIGTLAFTFAWLLLLSNPMAECRHETHRDSLEKSPLWKRVFYALCILVGTRGVGWNYQIEHIPPLPEESRTRFVLSRVVRILWYGLLTDVMQTYIALNPIFSLPEQEARSLRSQGLLLNVLNVLAYMGKSYGMLNMGYDGMALVSVAFGFSEPKYWPVVFGRWRDAYTVRRFWGRVWQQWLRRFCAGIGKFIARTLGCTPGTWLSSHVQLFVGFILSGLAHIPGDAMADRKWTGSSFWFFPAQAFAITLEDFVVDRGKALGVQDTRWVRLVGYVWTAAWFTYSTPWFVDWAVKAGLARGEVVPVSAVRPLLDFLSVFVGFDVTAWLIRQCAL